MIVHLDYEFRSGVDINDVGSHRASIDPEFEILLAAVSAEGSDRVLLWVNPAFRTCDMMGDNEEAEALLASADLVYAHNAPNEQANTWGALQQGKACPFKSEPPISIWRCTAAMARKAGMPNSLADLSKALGVPGGEKDHRGKALIRLFCQKNKPTKAELKVSPNAQPRFIAPSERPEDWYAFGEYCKQDVRAEKGNHAKLKPFELSGAQLETFLFDLRMNQRGIPINVDAAVKAQRIIDATQTAVTLEFRKLTLLNPTQRDKVAHWLAANDCPMENMQADTVEAAIQKMKQAKNPCLMGADDPEIRRRLKKAERAHAALTLYQKVSYAAVKKVQTMLDAVCPDGRVRGGHLFYGAGTGRWSGKILQPQNFRKIDPEFRELTDGIYRGIAAGYDPDLLRVLFGEPMECIANAIRHFIDHGQFEVLDGDYANVEARIVCWLAGQDDVLEKWRKGEDLYKWMAAYVYDVKIDAVTKDQREVGKRIILGAGFQMGPETFQRQCKIQYGLDLPLELCVKGIRLFRQLCPKIRDYWWRLNNQAVEAVRNPGAEYGPFQVRQIAGIRFLLFRLRSGRCLAYPHPKVEMVPWNRDDDGSGDLKAELTYWGELRPSVFGRIKLYGGKLCENETQATAADFMAHGAIVAERQGMAPFMLVHDQACALRDKGQTAEQFAAALATLPIWAKGFPLKVDAKITPYFTK